MELRIAAEKKLLSERDRLEPRRGGLQITEEFTKFAAAIPDLCEQPDKDSFLHFSVPVPFLRGRQDMFVREVYEALWDHVTNSSLKAFVVSGNAGIGKSWWLVWVLIKLLKAGKEVLWHAETQVGKEFFSLTAKVESSRSLLSKPARRQHADEMSHNLKHREPTVGASMWSLLQLLREGGICYLVDGAVPFANAMYRFDLSLVAHSYKPARFRGYQKQMSDVYGGTLFMDPWTPTEISKVAAKLHPQLSRSLVEERLNVLAGFPRQVFADLNHDPLADAEDALDNLEWEKLMSGFTPDAVGVPDTASHRLLLISAPAWRSGNFKTCQIEFRSYEIKRRVYEQITQTLGDQQRAFLAASDDKANSGMRAFKGLMMEIQMHETTPRGGVFKIR
eukprot:jgi/Astpho2/7566/Aster-02472